MRLVRLLGLVILVAGCAAPAPTPAFSRAQAIARAQQAVSESRPEYAPVQARIDEATGELISLQEAKQRLGDMSQAGDAAETVWLVTLKGKILFEGMPLPDAGRVINESSTAFVVLSAASGEQLLFQLNESNVAGVTPLPGAPAATP